MLVLDSISLRRSVTALLRVAKTMVSSQTRRFDGPKAALVRGGSQLRYDLPALAGSILAPVTVLEPESADIPAYPLDQDELLWLDLELLAHILKEWPKGEPIRLQDGEPFRKPDEDEDDEARGRRLKEYSALTSFCLRVSFQPGPDSDPADHPFHYTISASGKKTDQLREPAPDAPAWLITSESFRRAYGAAAGSCDVKQRCPSGKEWPGLDGMSFQLAPGDGEPWVIGSDGCTITAVALERGDPSATLPDWGRIASAPVGAVRAVCDLMGKHSNVAIRVDHFSKDHAAIMEFSGWDEAGAPFTVRCVSCGPYPNAWPLIDAPSVPLAHAVERDALVSAFRRATRTASKQRASQVRLEAQDTSSLRLWFRPDVDAGPSCCDIAANVDPGAVEALRFLELDPKRALARLQCFERKTRFQLDVAQFPNGKSGLALAPLCANTPPLVISIVMGIRPVARWHRSVIEGPDAPVCPGCWRRLRPGEAACHAAPEEEKAPEVEREDEESREDEEADAKV